MSLWVVALDVILALDAILSEAKNPAVVAARRNAPDSSVAKALSE
jgi:hypothetical protein